MTVEFIQEYLVSSCGPSVCRRGAATATLLLLCWPQAGAAGSEPVQVQFDCHPVIACRDVTPAGFADLQPGEKVVEARLRVSTRVIAGSAEDLREITFELGSPERRVRIVDFQPQTRLESELLGPIQITRTDESRRSLGLGLSGSMGVPAKGLTADLEPTAQLGVSRHEAVTRTVKKRPPQRPIVISGSTHQGHGVFFTLRPSSQSSLEGVHELRCQLRVPIAWRGDWLLLACRAEGRWTRYFVQTDGVCGQARYVLGLHAEGDQPALEAAERLGRAQWLEQEGEPDPDRSLPDWGSPSLRDPARALAALSGSSS